MDNIAFDDSGNLWIATDGQPSAIKVNDGVFGVPTAGRERGHVKQILSAVVGSEVASLAVDSPSQSMFVSIQHPGEGGTLRSQPATGPPAASPSPPWSSSPARTAPPSAPTTPSPARLRVTTTSTCQRSLTQSATTFTPRSQPSTTSTA